MFVVTKIATCLCFSCYIAYLLALSANVNEVANEFSSVIGVITDLTIDVFKELELSWGMETQCGVCIYNKNDIIIKIILFHLPLSIEK